MLANHEPRIGSYVRTMGGKSLGVVGAIRHDAFFVRDNGYGYWLRKDAVYLADGTITTLVCETKGVEYYRVV